MTLAKVTKLMRAPFSNKIVAFARQYWRLKTYLIYRPMFKHMGRNSVIFSPMIINNSDCIEIGDEVTIRNGIRLEAIRDPFGRIPSLVIGSNTNIEQNVHIICHSSVQIGRDVSITGRCAIVDTTHPYEDICAGKIGDLIANDDSFVEIGDGAFLGYGVVVLPNVRIGRRAVIGANSVVTRDVPDFSVAAGAPARIIKVYSRELGRWVAYDKTETQGEGG